ncbi:Spx/MgsR family RNA polymerase-binding regulatory protein [Lentilactobacillus sp. SPB1-3]|uniref:Spx/MgsR family RNA polymerase-binding regulatory protein n=1 Tax=Lentilactobacillus terminaliae TaxID=3003483 RepID=A0ACD5DFY3_9LACO|nr:Spx/MgsR family RNA polymerase-binding regulatory protein [Lentilactobacillus sp. SPB1-3]MCZ0976385.1 Spx/MgsR family RNA polymerase-binding regulatory protein [Lentilactobacillus sp. SPB1-3]
MITLYVSSSNSSSRKAREWLEEHDLQFEVRNMIREPLTRDEIKQLFSLSENGSEDLVSTRAKKYQEIKSRINDLTFSELVNILVKHQELIKRPIIKNDYMMQVGFSEEDIRAFLPRSVRKRNLELLTQKMLTV